VRGPSRIVVIALVALAACGEGLVRPGDDAAGWTRLPDAPLSPRYQAHAFWTGAELLVLGGRDSRPCPPAADCLPPEEPAFRDGAAYDPVAGTWAPVADAPIPLGSLTGAVLDGVLYLWSAGSEWEVGSRAAFLSYDPRADVWTELPAPPLPEGTFVGLVAAGDRLVGFHHSQERGVLPDLVFDPVGATWAELPPDPLIPSFDRWVVWTGEELVLTAIEHVPNPGSEGPAVYRAATLDLASGTWRRLPDSQVTGYNPEWFWSGGAVVNPTTGASDGGGDWDRPYPHGGVFHPTTGTWEDLPVLPSGGRGYAGFSVGGDRFVTSLDGWVLDTEEQRWTLLSRPEGAPDESAAFAWAGDRLVVWGGVRWDGEEATILGDGWSWSP
jgi:hypothetical protein